MRVPIVAGLAACSGDSVPDAPWIPITESVTSAPILEITIDGGVPEWRVDTSLRIPSEVVSSAGSQFLGSVAYAARLTSGETVVVDESNGTIRVFDSSGEFLRSGGGYGEGPGEFQIITSGARIGASRAFVWDQQLQRISVIDAGLFELRDPRRLRLTTSRLNQRYRFHSSVDDGRYLVTYAPRDIEQGTQSGDTLRHTAHILLWDEVGQEVRTILDVEGSLCVYEVIVMAGGRGAVFGCATVPLDKTILAAGSPEHIVVSDSNSHEYRLFESSGKPVRTVRLTGGPEPQIIDEDIVRRYIEAHPDLPRERADAVSYLIGKPLPVHQKIFVDGNNLWIEMFQLPWDAADREYLIVELEGGTVARARVPAEVEVFDIFEGWITGAVVDALGVPEVLVMRVAQ